MVCVQLSGALLTDTWLKTTIHSSDNLRLVLLESLLQLYMCFFVSRFGYFGINVQKIRSLLGEFSLFLAGYFTFCCPLPRNKSFHLFFVLTDENPLHDSLDFPHLSIYCALHSLQISFEERSMPKEFSPYVISSMV